MLNRAHQIFASVDKENFNKNDDDLIKAIEFVQNINEVAGILAIKNDKLAAWGEIEIISLKGGK